MIMKSPPRYLLNDLKYKDVSGTRGAFTAGRVARRDRGDRHPRRVVAAGAWPREGSRPEHDLLEPYPPTGHRLRCLLERCRPFSELPGVALSRGRARRSDSRQ